MKALTLIVLTSAVVSSPLALAQMDWPREIEGPEAMIVIYTPQLEAFKGDKLTARAAVSVTPKDEKEPVFGAAWFEARVSTDRDERLITLLDLEVTNVKFPDAKPEQIERFNKLVRRDLNDGVGTLSLDSVLTALKLVEKSQKQDENLKNDPPRIRFVTYPAILVTLDGEPVLQKKENTTVMQVMNTPFFMVLEPDSALYFLKGGGEWFSAKEIDGIWKPAVEVPSAVQVAASLDESAPDDDPLEEEKTKAPKIIVVKEPTELISCDGQPEYTPISDTGLLYMSNTETDLFMVIKTQLFFALMSGRWFQAASLEGPWTYIAPDALPGGFARILSESDKGHVLASVAGTEAAEEAVLDTYIPQTAAVDKKKAELTVVYDGEPKFEPIEDTKMQYAVNTSYSVILAEGRFYCCHEAIWFEAPSPKGPWIVCEVVPDIIYTIPPSSAVYNVKYVEVYDSTPDVVYVGYYPGYLGCYAHRGVVVYGTGWRYRPWRGRWYYPRPVTWGFSVRYSPVTGRWGFHVGCRGWGGWIGIGYHGHRSGWWGMGGYRSHRAHAHRSHSIYHRNKQAVRHQSAARAGNRSRATHQTKKKANNVYADRKGNVHRKTEQGWQQRDRSGWSSGENRDQQSRSNLNRQHDSRQRGSARTNNYQRQRSAPRGGRGRR